MTEPQTRDCCHRGNYYQPHTAPDGTYAHAPHCRNVKHGEYVACAGSCGELMRRDDNMFDGPGAFGYCDKCNPMAMVDVRLPKVLVDVGRAGLDWLKRYATVHTTVGKRKGPQR